MDIRELQIGDRVKISHLNKIGKIYRIDRANGKGNGYAAVIDGDYHEEDLQPIPLTSEILEKNGFEKEEYGLIWKSEQNVCDINGFPRIYAWVSFWKKGCIREVEISNIDTFYKDKIEQSNTYYVHELQHALRLCGIEKEITL